MPGGLRPDQLPNLAAWFRYGLNITSSGGAVSQWNDVSGNARHIKQSSANFKPDVLGDGSLLFSIQSVLATSGFTLNQPTTIYLVYRPLTWNSSAGVLDGSGFASGLVQQVTSSPKLRMFAGSSLGTVSPQLGAYCVLSLVFNGAASSIQMDDGPPLIGNAGSANMGGLTLGAAGGESFRSGIHVAELVAFSTAHSARTQSRLRRGYLYGVRNRAAANLAAVPPKILASDGDSQTVGFGVDENSTYPAQLKVLLGRGWFVYNAGVSGQQLTAMQADAATEIDTLLTAWAYTKKICCPWGGTNDITNGASAATAYSRLVAYCQARQLAGWKVAVFTCLPRTTTGSVPDFEAKRQDFNTSIRNNWASFADTLVDIGNDATIGVAGAETNATYYQADQIHPTAAADTIIANLANTALAGLV